MKKMKKLELQRIDLDELCHALEDHSGTSSWFIDATGKIHLFGDGMWDGEDVGGDFEPPDDCRRIDPIDSGESYEDLVAFSAMAREAKAGELLERAIAGRGAFRRFKDVLAEFPDLRTAGRRRGLSLRGGARQIGRLTTSHVGRLAGGEWRERSDGLVGVGRDLVHVGDRRLHDVVDLRLRLGREGNLHVG